MQIKCGTDIIEISRIKKSIDELGNKFINKIFTQDEIAYCESKKIQKFQHYAARFAAKEAIFKAISESVEDKYSIDWKDFEVTCDENGKPHINFLGTIEKDDIESMDISLSHCKEYAIANVVILYK